MPATYGKRFTIGKPSSSSLAALIWSSNRITFRVLSPKVDTERRDHCEAGGKLVVVDVTLICEIAADNGVAS